jgi:hypothetical protein
MSVTYDFDDLAEIASFFDKKAADLRKRAPNAPTRNGEALYIEAAATWEAASSIVAASRLLGGARPNSQPPTSAEHHRAVEGQDT